MKYLRTAPIALAMIALCATPIEAQQTAQSGGRDKSVLVLPVDQLKWSDGPEGLPAGSQIAILQGNPATPSEPYTLRLKFPANYRVPAHWHPQDEYVTVISGTVYFGTGDELNPSQGTELSQGSFFFVPAEDRHFAWTEEGATIQLHGVGPFDISYVDPANDPRQQATPAAD